MQTRNFSEALGGAATHNFTARNVAQFYSASFLATFSGSDLAGTFKVQASNDPPMVNGAKQDPTNWVDIPSASVAVTTATDCLITLPQLNYQWVRPVWTKSGGTGDMAVYSNMQGFFG